MADLFKFFRREKSDEGPHPRQEPRFKGAINSKTLEDIFAGCGDFETRSIKPGLIGEENIFVCWLDGVKRPTIL